MGKGKDNRIALWLATLSLAFSLHTLAQSDNIELGASGTADKVIDREGYALGYKAAWKTDRWGTYRLTDDEVLNQVARRSEEFAPDPQIAGDPQLEDYRGSGYDRGHLAPAADMKWSQRAMTECFYLSNMVPHDRENNGGIWNEIENTVRVATTAAPKAAQPATASKVSDSYFAGIREEYRASGAMPVGSRKAAPVCDKWPDTGWWLSTNSMKQHNRKCENYRKTRGYPCRKDDGSPCGKCGG